MRLMLVSSLPKAFVATQVKRAESLRSSFLMLKSDSTPVGRISSRMVYLQKADQKHEGSTTFVELTSYSHT